MATQQAAAAFADALRPVAPAYGLIVHQVTDNPVRADAPYGWSVQLLDVHTGLPAYVTSMQAWATLQAHRSADTHAR